MTVFDDITDRVEGFLDDLLVSERVRDQLARASRLIDRDNYDQAERLLEEARDSEPQVHRIHQLLGLCRLEQGEPDRAGEALDRALELREDPTSHFYAGLAAERTDSPEVARLHYHRALGLAEDHPFEFEVHLGLGRIYLELGRADRAANELEKALATDPDRDDARLALARAELRRGDVDAAGALVDQLLEGDAPDVADVSLELLRADVAAHREEWEVAADAYDRAADAVSGAEAVDALVGSARAHLELGTPSRARTRLLRALDAIDREGPVEARIQLLLGRAFRQISESERAVPAFERALECAADDSTEAARAHLRLGESLVDLDRLDEARAHLRSATHDDDTADRARLALARIRLERDDLTGARRLLEDLRHDPELAVEAHRLLASTALRSADPATAAVELQEALFLTDDANTRSSLERQRERVLERLAPDWELPDSLEGPLELEAVLSETADEIGDHPAFEPFLADLHSLESALKEPLSIAVVGEFNAGKSTLVNALVGEEVVPMGVLPTTAHTCIFRYGARKAARIHYEAEDRNVDEVDLREARRRMEEQAPTIEHLEFLYPHPHLRSVEFWDTPGFNAADDGGTRGDQIASDALESAEAVLWVVDATQTLSQTEFEVLEGIPDSGERVLVVLNKVDQLPDDEPVGDQIERLAERVRGAVAGDVAGIFGLSARRGLERRTSEHDGSDVSRFEEFERELDLRLTQRSGRIKTGEGRRALRELARGLQRAADGLVGTYAELGERADELHAWIEERAGSLPEASTDREVRSVEDGTSFALDAVAREIHELLRPSGTLFREMELPEADRSYALDLLERRYVDVLERSQNRVLEEIEEVEGEVARRTGQLLDEMPAERSRPFDRRLEGLYDDIRAMRVVLDERVYGRLRARSGERIRTIGPDVLDDSAPSDDAVDAWKDRLEPLVPEAAAHVDGALTDWYREFFVVLRRFSDRVRRDLRLLELEADHRHDFAPLLDFLGHHR